MRCGHPEGCTRVRRCGVATEECGRKAVFSRYSPHPARIAHRPLPRAGEVKAARSSPGFVKADGSLLPMTGEGAPKGRMRGLARHSLTRRALRADLSRARER